MNYINPEESASFVRNYNATAVGRTKGGPIPGQEWIVLRLPRDLPVARATSFPIGFLFGTDRDAVSPLQVSSKHGFAQRATFFATQHAVSGSDAARADPPSDNGAAERTSVTIA